MWYSNFFCWSVAITLGYFVLLPVSKVGGCSLEIYYFPWSLIELSMDLGYFSL